MRKNVTFLGILIFTLILMFFINNTNAQKGDGRQGTGGWGTGSRYTRMYDPKTVEIITGTVINVERVIPKKGMSAGVHLMMRTEAETISVHIGPAWFIENQDIMIEPEDNLEIKGSRIIFEGKPAIIAEKIEKGKQTLQLRAANGVPVWSGWRRNQKSQ